MGGDVECPKGLRKELLLSHLGVENEAGVEYSSVEAFDKASAEECLPRSHVAVDEGQALFSAYEGLKAAEGLGMRPGIEIEDGIRGKAKRPRFQPIEIEGGAPGRNVPQFCRFHGG